MNVKSEELEKSMVRITVDLPADDFEKAAQAAYMKNKNRFNIPGFRRGHVRKEIIEKLYGEGVFYEDAADSLINSSYPEALKEAGLRPVSRPEIDVVQIKSGEDFVYTALFAVRPPVDPGVYRGVKVEKTEVHVSDEDIDAELKKAQDQSARIVTLDDEDRELREGDIAVIDFEGSVDGVPFEGGSGADYPLTIGSGSFIPGFEKQLIGMKAGEERDIEVTFPEDYQASELAGQNALFRVKLNEIREKQLPDIDDEFASEVSEFETLDEYKASLGNEIRERREKAAAQENEDKVLKAVVEQASVELPEAMVATALDRRREEYARRFEGNGFKFEDYLRMSGQTEESFREQLRPEIEESLRTRLVLEEIALREGLHPDDEALEERLEAMAKSYKMSTEDLKKAFSPDDIEAVRDDMAIQEAVDLVVADAVLESAAGEEDEGKDEVEI